MKDNIALALSKILSNGRTVTIKRFESPSLGVVTKVNCDHATASSSISKLELERHRYGAEEMLAYEVTMLIKKLAETEG